MKLERIAKENEKKREFERQYVEYEEEQKNLSNSDEDDDKDLEAFGEVLPKPDDLQKAREIEVKTVIDEF